MEDVLDVYEEPYDPARPVVCFDESPKQLIAEVRPPEPPAPGKPAREDTEYERMGVRDLMMICGNYSASRKKVLDKVFRDFLPNRKGTGEGFYTAR